MDKYKSTEGWKDFVWIEEGVPSGINDIKQETKRSGSLTASQGTEYHEDE